MTQGREPPAFQEYPAKMMSSLPYRMMSLAARGLLYSLRLECWENRRMPADPVQLARLLHYEPAQIAEALPEVLPFFEQAEGFISCPELENYRANLDERRARQAEGGRQGAAKTNGQRGRNASASDAASKTAGKPRVTRQAGRESLVQSSPDQSKTAKPNSIQALNEEPISDDWMSDYERASRGYE